MNIESAFPSTYVKAADLGGKNARLIIRSVTMETVGNEQKPIMYFEKRDKGLVLNRTNANTISLVYGQNTDDWVGGEIELFPAMVDFQGRTVEAIRVRIPPRKPQAAKSQYDNGFDDPRTAPPARTAAPAGGSIVDEMSDEIPFAAEWRG